MSTPAVRGSVPTSSISAEIPEGPIKGLIPELVGNILFLSDKNDRENTSVVCHQWRILTLVAYKKANQADVEQFISKLVEKMDAKKHPHLWADCQEICQVSQSLNQRVTTAGQAARLFLIINGLILGLLRKVTPNEKSVLEKSIGLQISSSMGRIFELSSWDLEYAIEKGDLNAFCIVLHSYQRITKGERGQAVYQAVSHFQPLALQLLLASGPISEADRGLAVCCAALNGQKNALQLLLTNGPVSEADLDQAIQCAIQEGNLEAATEILCKCKEG